MYLESREVSIIEKEAGIKFEEIQIDPKVAEKQKEMHTSTLIEKVSRH